MTRRHYDLPSLNALAAFEAVARNLNVTRAATELNVTPGAVSKQIRQLEAELGRQLMQRHSTGISLTSEGEEVAASLHEAFGRVSATLRHVRASGERAHVSIISTMATMQLWLMPRLGSFWGAHPEIVVEHVISDRLHDVPRPDIDLRIRYGDGHWPGEEARLIQSDRVVAVASPAFLARHPIADPEALAAAPLLSVEGADWVWMTWGSFLRAAGVPFHRLNVRRFNSYVIALQAARDGQGVSLGWMSSVAPLIARGELQKVTQTEIDDPNAFYVTWNDRRTLSAEATILRDWLLAQGY
ncbi:LysR substrate-binding domain-containing protein [Tabrizicola oligotrophica]|uniref:LysR family transcriptional regulator n=1 Tax=Tabrizicola oligotrophica TaxID=2710650 RepID=A0A6M0QX08_9RHOB|nr:LysR substrate-binding domain-containing protein [Tabrizicola oligotrophica]NEY91980.1 LysR family transcriptional regulator [Tabrizicola oligotrophica]